MFAFGIIQTAAASALLCRFPIDHLLGPAAFVIYDVFNCSIDVIRIDLCRRHSIVRTDLGGQASSPPLLMHALRSREAIIATSSVRVREDVDPNQFAL